MRLKKPKFWDENKLSVFSLILYPFSFITFLFSFLRIKKKSSNRIKTICVGNIYIGGTGKTTLALKLNEILKKKYKTVFIKKKYSNQQDEQNILSNYGNLICEKDRSIALKKAEKKGYEVAIFDDGLQDYSIQYDLKIACFNSKIGLGNKMLLPAGPLREGVNSLKNFDIVFLNGFKKNIKFENFLKKKFKNLKIFKAKYKYKKNKNINNKKNFLSFSGIGNPHEFDKSLKLNKIKVKKKISFPDHYIYKNDDLIQINKYATKNNLQVITTEKDYMRINKSNIKKIKVFKVDLEITNEKKFTKLLLKKI